MRQEIVLKERNEEFLKIKKNLRDKSKKSLIIFSCDKLAGCDLAK